MLRLNNPPALKRQDAFCHGSGLGLGPGRHDLVEDELDHRVKCMEIAYRAAEYQHMSFTQALSQVIGIDIGVIKAQYKDINRSRALIMAQADSQRENPTMSTSPPPPLCVFSPKRQSPEDQALNTPKCALCETYDMKSASSHRDVLRNRPDSPINQKNRSFRKSVWNCYMGNIRKYKKSSKKWSPSPKDPGLSPLTTPPAPPNSPKDEVIYEDDGPPYHRHVANRRSPEPECPVCKEYGGAGVTNEFAHRDYITINLKDLDKESDPEQEATRDIVRKCYMEKLRKVPVAPMDG